MPYRVRSPDGELQFPHLADVAQAYSAGLVDPEDEVQEVGSSTWHKARTLTVLAGTKVQARQGGKSPARTAILAAVLGMLSLYLMFFMDNRMARTVGFLLALVLSFQMTRIMTRAGRRPS
jgi:hypothetical protein